jgi:signal transduction histidine kinase
MFARHESAFATHRLRRIDIQQKGRSSELHSGTHAVFPRLDGVRPIWRSPPVLHFAIAIMLPVLAASSTFMLITSRHLEQPGAAAIFKTYMTVVCVFVGLVWWRRRQSSRIGPLLVVYGLLFWASSLKGPANPVMYNLGVVADVASAFAYLYIIVSFPSGNLRTRVDRVLVAFAAFGFLAIVVALMLVAPTIEARTPLFQCVPSCPVNVFRITSNPALTQTIENVETYFLLAVTVAALLLYCRRWWVATHAQRRMLSAVAVTALLYIPAYSVFETSVRVFDVDQNVVLAASEWTVVLTLLMFPLSFLVVLLQVERFAERALHRLLHDLATRPTLDGWRGMVADAIDDPSLRIGYWNPTDKSFREPDGLELPPLPDAGKHWVHVESNGRPMAAMVVDEMLTLDPEMIMAAVSATRLAVENGQLESELRTSLKRLAAAADNERRRIARDLHDSTQQRLVTLRIHLSLAGDWLDRPEEQAMIEELGHEVDEALAELRNVTYGFYSPVLRQYGIGPALRSAVIRGTLAVRIVDQGLRRHGDAIEQAVYFCCLEALQNVAKHAGKDASAVVRLVDQNDELCFEVEDSGLGFVPETVGSGAGLANLTDRLKAVGGDLLVDSTPGKGSRISGRIPLSGSRWEVEPRHTPAVQHPGLQKH